MILACRRRASGVYNDWLIDYCQVDLDRLVGIPVHLDLRRRPRGGGAGTVQEGGTEGRHHLAGAAPGPAVQVRSLQSLLGGGAGYGHASQPPYPDGTQLQQAPRSAGGVEHYRGSVNLKAMDAINAVFDFLFYGILDRYPRLKLVIVENEIGWIPFFLQQWDYYYRRFGKTILPRSSMEPSEYFLRQSTRPFSTTQSADTTSRGGAWTTACGPTTSRIQIRRGRTRARSSSATWATCRPTREGEARARERGAALRHAGSAACLIWPGHKKSRPKPNGTGREKGHPWSQQLHPKPPSSTCALRT